MAIISISMSENDLEQLDRIKDAYGLKGRSDAIRHSIRTADNELRELEEISGPVEGVLIIVHDHHGDVWMDRIEHRYEKDIRTHLHSHLLDRKCLEVMVISTDPDTLREMVSDIHSTGKAAYVRFVRG